jgi:pSer/pThr/pTyr-binding forkhead associated (FHA) protein
MASLYIAQGPDLGRRIELTQEITICGRNPTCAIAIPLMHIARQHFRIVRHSDQFYIEDMDTLPGTRVNDRQIREATLLRDGDRIDLGGFTAVFESGNVEVRIGDPSDTREPKGQSQESRTEDR